MDLMRWLVLSVLISLSLNVQAGKNPVGWTMSGNIPAATQLNHSYSLSFILTNNMPFTMPTALKISNNTTPLSQVTMVDNCSGKKLAAGQTCSVGLVLIPKTAGTKTLSIFMEYGNNKVKIPQPVLSTTTAGGAISLLEGVVLVGFPTAILSNTPYPLSLEFINNSTVTINNLVLSQNPNNTAGFTQGSVTNCNSLTPGGKCIVTGSFTTAASTGAASVGYTLNSSGLSGEATSSSIINNTTGSAVRTFTFVNNCGFNVWFGLVSSNVNGNPCITNNDCTYPSICNPAANKGAGYCFYPTPAPANGVYELSASGGTNTASIPDYGFQYVWSGNMAGRTGCSGSTCATADCGGGTGACPTGQGFNQPASLGEFTLQRSTIDSYDLSILNGTNIGIQATPTTSFTFANGFSPPEYNCTSPGKVTQTNGLGGCSWTFDPTLSPVPAPAYRYRYVTPTTNIGCTDATSCPGLTVCGLNFDRSAGTLNSYCGTLLGYNTPNQVCSYKGTSTTIPTTPINPGDAYFNCDSASGVTSAGNINGTTGNLPAGTAYTNWALLSCQAQPNMDLNTCFNTNANPPPSTSNGCGCVNWATFGSGVVVPSDTLPCITSNATWTSNVLPGIILMKRGCPTAYSWPFDDKSSSFGCSDIGGSHTTNTVNYTITFCPT
jgi:hypothetical protein